MLGVLGGMGPLATADFMQKLVRATPSKNDQNHIPAIVWSVPQVADRSAHIIYGHEDPHPRLFEGMHRLKSAGACVIAIPCNTAHYWADQLSDAVGLTILSMADAVAEKVKHLLPEGGTVGLLATDGTVKANIYQNKLDQKTWPIISPCNKQQDELMKGIRFAKAGDSVSAKNIFSTQITALLDQGAERIILGCTELPSVVEENSLLIDSNSVLAHRCVSWYRANFGLV